MRGRRRASRSEIREWSRRACEGFGLEFVRECVAFATRLQESFPTEMLAQCLARVCGVTTTARKEPLATRANLCG